MDSFHKVFEGIKNTVKYDDNVPMKVIKYLIFKQRRSRKPRLMYGLKQYFKEYSVEDIIIIKYIKKI